jgi:hypothetical protein
METEFEEEADAPAWLVKPIAAALEQVEKAGIEAAMLSKGRDR